MPVQKWTTQEQYDFLLAEDDKWPNVKVGNSLLKSFYIRTAKAFLEKWPIAPDAETLEEAGGNIEEANALVEAQLTKVSLIPS